MAVDGSVLNGEEVCSIKSFHGSIINPSEVCIARSLLQALEQCRYDVSNVVVLSPYRSQVVALKRSLQEMPSIGSRCDVSTIDKYQGRDSDVVIVSTVRSNTSGNTGELLRDWRRINVAITR